MTSQGKHSFVTATQQEVTSWFRWSLKNTPRHLIKNMEMCSQFGGYQIQLNRGKKNISDYISITVSLRIFHQLHWNRGWGEGGVLSLNIEHKVCLWLNGNCSDSSWTQTRLNINSIIYDSNAPTSDGDGWWKTWWENYYQDLFITVVPITNCFLLPSPTDL